MSIPDRKLETVTRRQYGAFNIAQARTAGFTKAMIQQRVRVRAWTRKARGVYVLAAVPPSWAQHLMVAVLREPWAVVSHHPGCAVHDLTGFGRRRPELTVPANANHRSELATIHRSDDVEHTVVAHIPVVTALQALFDVAGSVPLPMLRAAADDAINRNLIDPARMADRFVALAPKLNRGIGDMRALVDTFCDVGFVPAQSTLEAMLFDLLEELGIDHIRQFAFDWRAPTPMVVDCFAASLDLIVEADGRTWHDRLAAQEADRHRDNVAAAHGIHTMRFTHTMLTNGQDETRSVLGTYVQLRQGLDAALARASTTRAA